LVFTLTDVVALIFAFVVILQFWHIRAITEMANRYLVNYCNERQLQLLSVARSKTRLGLHRGKPDWHTVFEFEFSGNGTDRYSGQLFMEGKKVVSTDLPAYRVSETDW